MRRFVPADSLHVKTNGWIMKRGCR